MTKTENERLANVEGKLDVILENHLPHIQKLLYICIGASGTLTLGFIALVIRLLLP